MKATIFSVLTACLLLAPVAATAQSGEGALSLDAPRGASSARYLGTVAGDGLQVNIVYLSPDAPLDAAEEEPVEEAAGEGGGDNAAVGWTVLALSLLAALALLYRGRHVLAELFGGSDRRPRAAPAGSKGMGEGADPALDTDLLARLRQESDPRVGLRQVLARFLALAARENGVALRRNLTTREILGALPGDWSHRGDLDRLARQVELTVFGGREMNRSQYDECLDLAAPLLFRVEPA